MKGSEFMDIVDDKKYLEFGIYLFTFFIVRPGPHGERILDIWGSNYTVSSKVTIDDVENELLLCYSEGQSFSVDDITIIDIVMLLHNNDWAQVEKDIFSDISLFVLMESEDIEEEAEEEILFSSISSLKYIH